jgi:hypothetical protein
MRTMTILCGIRVARDKRAGFSAEHHFYPEQNRQMKTELTVRVQLYSTRTTYALAISSALSTL